MDHLAKAIQEESQKFSFFYQWLEQHMPPAFFEEISTQNLPLITHSLMELDRQEFFTAIGIKQGSFALCLDHPDSDEKILQMYSMKGIKNYRTFVSDVFAPFPQAIAPLRIAIITFTQYDEETTACESFFSEKEKTEIFTRLQEKNPSVSKQDFFALLQKLNSRFLRALSPTRLTIALDMFFRAQSRDNCQYEIRYNKDWPLTKNPSLQIIFAWKDVAKYNFLYLIAKLAHRHQLTLKKVNAIYIDPYDGQNILLMSLAIHGIHGEAAWQEANIEDFLQELVTLKYFEGMDLIEKTFVQTGLLRGNLGNLVKALCSFIHQILASVDIHAYSFLQIEENLCSYSNLISLVMKAFEQKFHPQNHNLQLAQKTLETFSLLTEEIDTGNEINDTRSKNILRQAKNFVNFCLKTNFYRNNKTAFCFRLDPSFLRYTPIAVQEKFPELPYAIYFMKGFHFFGFHIRFKDLARGGLRTIIPPSKEQMLIERNHVFSECYHLAYTQQKKNKDIPEGGAKGVIFLEPFSHLKEEKQILQDELIDAKIPDQTVQQIIQSFTSAQKTKHLHQSQRSYIESFLPLINCHPDGTLKAKHIVDYWKKTEYIYLGPDENMHNDMIEWIAQYSQHYGYKPGGAFISSKPSLGINHKEFGVTSLGVNVCMEQVLSYLKIDPKKEVFTVKMSGGPDGDVAGNQMLNLLRFYPKTAKLLTTIDISGTLLDLKGLDLTILEQLFFQKKPLAEYPPDKLSEGGFILDTRTKNENKQVLLIQKKQGKVEKSWIFSHEANKILHQTIFQTKADIFIPAGGRPKTLNEDNVTDFLIGGVPSAKAIIEGANLYLTPKARSYLEALGTLIIKDSSANKGGVICSSFEVLCSLCLTPEEFLLEKKDLVSQILQIIAKKAQAEASLLLQTHTVLQTPLTLLSEEISQKINDYTYEILSYLEPLTLSEDRNDPLNQAILHYLPSTLSNKYSDRIFSEVPPIHKKAICACHIASCLVYQKGLSWKPKITDILPWILQQIL